MARRTTKSAKRSEAAKKAAATRKKNAQKRSEAAKKAAATRKKNAAKKAAPKKKTAAKKGAATRKKAAPKKKTAAKKAAPKRKTSGEIFIRPTTNQLRQIYFGPKKPRNVSCSYCGIDVSNKMHIDHIRAWIKSHNNAKSNLTPACPACNLSKKTATLLQWFKRLQKNGGADRRRLTKIKKYNHGFIKYGASIAPTPSISTS